MGKLAKAYKLLDPKIRTKNLALNWELRGRCHDLARPALPDPVFLVGCSRSGTTVTYETLGPEPKCVEFGREIPQFWDGLHGPLNNGWASEAAGAEHAPPEHRAAPRRTVSTSDWAPTSCSTRHAST